MRMTSTRSLRKLISRSFAEGNRLMEEMKKQIETEKESAIRDIRRQVPRDTITKHLGNLHV